jgi:predicted Zn-dependent protease
MTSYLYTALGLALLLSIVGFQYFRRHKTQQQLMTHWKEAQRALVEKRIDDAERALRACLELMPLMVMARRALGAVLAQQDRLDEAERELKMAAELQPRKPEGHLDLALFYARYQPDRADDTIHALKEAVVHAPQLREDIFKDPRFAALHRFPEFAAFGAEAVPNP